MKNNTGEMNMSIKRDSLFFVILFCVNISSFPENLFADGKQLIFGWYFSNKDTSQQTNVAIEAALRYAEAAKYQMESYEKYNLSCKIELYREKSMYSLEEDDEGGIFVYINERNKNDYHDRYIEINFYKMYDMYEKLYHKYTLVLYYNDYDWLENNNERHELELMEKGESAFDYFVSEIRRFRR
jgi:hypothetical protein